MKNSKKSPIFKYTEKSPYGLPGGFKFSLGAIDKKERVCWSRVSEDEALANKYGFWRACLEEVGNFFRSEDKSLIFHGHPDRAANIKNFINFIEEKLNLDKKCEVFETDVETITAIRVSQFWLDCPLRRCMLLNFIRAGQDFATVNEESFQNLLNSNNYFSKTKPMLDLFFDGYVIFSKICLETFTANFHRGPVAQFLNLTSEQILSNKMLNKPR